MKNKQVRKTLNVSIQSKKYFEPVNVVLERWKEEGANISVSICELILLSDKYEKSIVLTNVKNLYELIEKIVAMNKHLSPEEQVQVIEHALNEIISIDNSKITNVLSNIPAIDNANNTNDTSNTNNTKCETNANITTSNNTTDITNTNSIKEDLEEENKKVFNETENSIIDEEMSVCDNTEEKETFNNDTDKIIINRENLSQDVTYDIPLDFLQNS